MKIEEDKEQREGIRVESRLWQRINWLKVQNIRIEPKQNKCIYNRLPYILYVFNLRRNEVAERRFLKC